MRLLGFLVVTAAAQVATSACAQSSVTISGRIDVSVNQLRIKALDGSTRNLSAVSSDASRLVFSGTEDLGDGLKAKFLLDQGINADTGTFGQGGLAFGREAFVGLAGSFGDIRLGRNYIPVDDMASVLDPFYFLGIGAAWPMLPYTARINNSIKYFSPSLAGFRLEALISASEGVAGGKFTGVGGQYANDTVEAYLSHTIQTAGAPTGDRKETLVGGAFKFAGNTVTVLHFERDDPNVAKRTTNLLGARIPAGLGEIRTSYTQEKQNASSAKKLAAMYLYPFSKRTTVYAGFARLSNKGSLADGLNPALPAVGPGETVTGAQIGLRKNF